MSSCQTLCSYLASIAGLASKAPPLAPAKAGSLCIFTRSGHNVHCFCPSCGCSVCLRETAAGQGGGPAGAQSTQQGRGLHKSPSASAGAVAKAARSSSVQQAGTLGPGSGAEGTATLRILPSGAPATAGAAAVEAGALRLRRCRAVRRLAPWRLPPEVPLQGNKQATEPVSACYAWRLG